MWLLLEVLTPDLGKDQLPGFLLIREEDLPGKHYHLLSARVAKKSFPKVKDKGARKITYAQFEKAV